MPCVGDCDLCGFDPEAYIYAVPHDFWELGATTPKGRRIGATFMLKRDASPAEICVAIYGAAYKIAKFIIGLMEDEE